MCCFNWTFVRGDGGMLFKPDRTETFISQSDRIFVFRVVDYTHRPSKTCYSLIRWRFAILSSFCSSTDGSCAPDLKRLCIFFCWISADNSCVSTSGLELFPSGTHKLMRFNFTRDVSMNSYTRTTSERSPKTGMLRCTVEVGIISPPVYFIFFFPSNFFLRERFFFTFLDMMVLIANF